MGAYLQPHTQTIKLILSGKQTGTGMAYANKRESPNLQE